MPPPQLRFLSTIICVQWMVIILSAEQQYDRTISCASNTDCMVHCDESNSCQNSYIRCPQNYQCNIQCNTFNSCYNTTIDAKFSSLFTIKTNKLSNTGLTIYFPPHSYIYNINDAPNDPLIPNLKPLPLHFYTTNGWKDIVNNDYTKHKHALYGTIHCIDHNAYNISCSFQDSCCNKPTKPTHTIQRRHLLQATAYSTITNTWHDDYAIVPPNNIGWQVIDQNGANSAVVTANSYSSFYHGPFSGDNDNSQEQFHMIQQFYCNVKSSVSIYYFLVFCGTENSDYVSLYLNDQLAVKTNLGGSGIPYDDALMEQASDCNDLEYYYLGPYTIQEVLKNSLFKVHFQIVTNFRNDAIGLSGIQITCTPLPTLAPTPEPTMTTLAPTLKPTESPTTAQPSSDPTKTPTASPTSPTQNPSVSPTTSEPTINPSVSPTKSPTRNPSVFPTKSPTKTPTKLTKAPSKIPTKPPTAKPSVSPTKVPTKNPTVNPTKTPTEHPSISPTKAPTRVPTKSPTFNPSVPPTTSEPTINPSVSPTKSPTRNPSVSPTKSPTKYPSKSPTNAPTSYPTKNPVVPLIVKKPTQKPLSDGQIEAIETTANHIDTTETNGYSANKKSESVLIESILYMLLGFGIIACISCIIVLIYCRKKRLKNRSNSVLNMTSEIQLQDRKKKRSFDGIIENANKSLSRIKKIKISPLRSPKHVNNMSLQQNIMSMSPSTGMQVFNLDDVHNDDDIDIIADIGDPMSTPMGDNIVNGDDDDDDDIIHDISMLTPMGEIMDNGNNNNNNYQHERFKTDLENDTVINNAMMDDIIGHMSTPMGNNKNSHILLGNESPMDPYNE